MRPLDCWEEVGWLNNRVWLAHDIDFQDPGIARLGRADLGVMTL
ncbi:MAG: hypothetical protein NTW56_13100 [Alphaproteobacteria bacterium]|nr:hypothetical protein [Alphaproteobacteria bacterium]